MKNILVFCCIWLSLNASALVTSTVETRIFHNSVTATDSRLNFMISLSNGWIQGTSSITSLKVYNVTSGSSVLIYTHASASTNTGLLSNLTPGIYQFVGNVSTMEGRSFVSVAVNQFVWIGINNEWQNILDVTRSGNQYDLKRNQISIGNTNGFAQSFNATPSSTSDAWIELKKSNNLPSGDNRLFWILEPIANISSFTPSMNITYIEYKTVNGVTTNTLKYKLSNGNYTTTILSTNPNDKFRLVREANVTTLQKNSENTTLKTLVNISGILKISLVFNNIGVEAAEITSSLPVPNSNLPFAVSETPSQNASQLTIRINPLTGTVGPYNYFVSTETIDEEKTLYKFLKDSLNGGVLDSATFFRGNTTVANRTISNLDNGFYNIAVFDSRGIKIQSFSKLVEQSMVFGESKDVILRDGDLFVTKSDGYWTNNFISTDGQNASILYQIKQIDPEQTFGFLNAVNTISGGAFIYSKIEAGVFIRNGLLFTIDRGVKSASSAPVTINSTIYLEKNSNEILIYLNNALIGTVIIPVSHDLKSGVYLKGWGSTISVFHGGFIKNPFKINWSISNTTCTSETVNITVSSPGTGSTDLFGNAFVSKSLQLYNFTNGNLPTGAINQSVFSSLEPGVYNLTGTITFGSTTYNVNRFIYAGLPNEWENELNLIAQTQQALLKPHAIANTTVNWNTSIPGEGISSNKLGSNLRGWISFKLVPATSASNGYNLFTLSESPLAGFVDTYNATDFALIKSNSSALAVINNPDIGNYNIFVPNSAPFVIQRNATGVVSVSQNGINITNPMNAFYFGRWKFATKLWRANSGAGNIVSNFKCNNSQGQYAQLKYELDGYYHVMKNGFVRFVFNQEYNTTNLKFNLYNPNGELVRTQANFPNISVTNGPNYIDLDVRGQYCIGTGFFYLEFINDKKERLYLRFYNEYSDPNCVYPIGSNEQSE